MMLHGLKLRLLIMEIDELLKSKMIKYPRVVQFSTIFMAMATYNVL